LRGGAPQNDTYLVYFLDYDFTLRRNGIPMPFRKADIGMSAYGLRKVSYDISGTDPALKFPFGANLVPDGP
jgi:hypothetical protein